jgi:hypothetical protein
LLLEKATVYNKLGKHEFAKNELDKIKILEKLGRRFSA